jgi:hypothetical protein
MISEFMTFIIHQAQTDKQVIKATHNFASVAVQNNSSPHVCSPSATASGH